MEFMSNEIFLNWAFLKGPKSEKAATSSSMSQLAATYYSMSVEIIIHLGFGLKVEGVVRVPTFCDLDTLGVATSTKVPGF